MFKRRKLSIPTFQTRGTSNFYPSIQQAMENIRERERGEGGIHAFVWTSDGLLSFLLSQALET